MRAQPGLGRSGRRGRPPRADHGFRSGAGRQGEARLPAREGEIRFSGLTSRPGDTVASPRALECPVQLEAKLAHVHEMAQDEKIWRGARAIEVRITRVHAHPSIMMEGEANRIDPDKWRPL